MNKPTVHTTCKRIYFIILWSCLSVSIIYLFRGDSSSQVARRKSRPKNVPAAVGGKGHSGKASVHSLFVSVELVGSRNTTIETSITNRPTNMQSSNVDNKIENKDYDSKEECIIKASSRNKVWHIRVRVFNL